MKPKFVFLGKNLFSFFFLLGDEIPGLGITLYPPSLVRSLVMSLVRGRRKHRSSQHLPNPDSRFLARYIPPAANRGFSKILILDLAVGLVDKASIHARRVGFHAGGVVDTACGALGAMAPNRCTLAVLGRRVKDEGEDGTVGRLLGIPRTWRRCFFRCWWRRRTCR